MGSRFAAMAGLVVVLAISAVLTLKWNEGTPKTRQADAQNILDILRVNPEAIIRQLDPVKLDLSLPGDGRGARLLVRVEPGVAEQVPSSVYVEHDGITFEIPLEVSETYEDYVAQ